MNNKLGGGGVWIEMYMNEWLDNICQSCGKANIKSTSLCSYVKYTHKCQQPNPVMGITWFWHGKWPKPLYRPPAQSIMDVFAEPESILAKPHVNRERGTLDCKVSESTRNGSALSSGQSPTLHCMAKGLSGSVIGSRGYTPRHTTQFPTLTPSHGSLHSRREDRSEIWGNGQTYGMCCCFVAEEGASLNSDVSMEAQRLWDRNGTFSQTTIDRTHVNVTQKKTSVKWISP